MAPSQNKNEHIEWPKRAVVTAGMPYGNKSLHFGHVGGVFLCLLTAMLASSAIASAPKTWCSSPAPIVSVLLSKRGIARKLNPVLSREPWKTMFVVITIVRRQRSMRTTSVLMCTRAAASVIAARFIAPFLPPLCSVFTKRDSCIWKAPFSSMTLREGMFLNGRQVVGALPCAGLQERKSLCR